MKPAKKKEKDVLVEGVDYVAVVVVVVVLASCFATLEKFLKISKKKPNSNQLHNGWLFLVHKFDDYGDNWRRQQQQQKLINQSIIYSNWSLNHERFNDDDKKQKKPNFTFD